MDDASRGSVTIMTQPPAIHRLREHRSAVAWIIACSLLPILPLLFHGPSCGHDFDFHLLSWLETSQSWRQRHFYPHWLATANYGAGEPRFLFYPPLSWLLGALFGSVAATVSNPLHAWTFAPLLFTWISIVFAAVSVYLLARTWAAATPSAVAACLFLGNPYLLFVAYERTAYAELLATGFIALLLRVGLSRDMKVPPLALLITGLWLTNAPAAVMGCYTLAALTTIRIVQQRNWRLALNAAAACLLGTALSGFYLVPAAWEQRWVQIDRAISYGMRVNDSFLFSHTGNLYHDQVLHTASWLVVLVLGIGLAAALVAHRFRKVNASILTTPVLLLALILLLQFPVSTPLWRAAPHLLFLQFPWRWLLVASILAAALVAMALPPSASTRSRTLLLSLACLLTAASTFTCWHNFQQPCDEQDAVSGQLGAFHNASGETSTDASNDASGVEGTDEYTAVGADNSAIEQDMPQVRLLADPDGDEPPSSAGDNPEWTEAAAHLAPGTVTVQTWLPMQKHFLVKASRPAYAVITLMAYPAWEITRNGQVLSDLPKREDGLLPIPVPVGNSTITVHWRTTRDVLWGRALSLAALFALCGTIALPHLRRRTLSQHQP